MEQYQTGAVRDTGGKGRMDLLPMCALIRVSKHMEDAIKPDPETGKSHYPERNWEQGLPLHSMIDSALRHIAKYVDGQTDEDHLCAAATNLLMAMWTEEKLPDMVDIPAVWESHIERIPDHNGGYTSEYRSRPEDHPVTRQAYSHEKRPDPEGCLCYRSRGYGPDDVARCFGTKDQDPCGCGGDRTKCDFYPEIREEATKKSSHKTIFARVL